jgi:hypothetical protein
MYFGPYVLFNETDDHSVEFLKEGIKTFLDTEKWPRNKVMKLRETIPATEPEISLFEKEMVENHLSLPNGKTSIWENIGENKPDKNQGNKPLKKMTPFFDQIELSEFYLNQLI